MAYPWIVALLQADSHRCLGTVLLISAKLLQSSDPLLLLLLLLLLLILGRLAQMYRRVRGCKTIYIFPLSGQVGFLPDTFTGKGLVEHIVSVRRAPECQGGGKVASHREPLGLRATT